MLDKVLKERIESKSPNNFWELFDSIILYGYSPMDSLGTALMYFKESDIWKDVAYCKMVSIEKRNEYIGGHDPYMEAEFGQVDVQRVPRFEHALEVGIIDEENKHLIGLFDFYRKSIVEKKLEFNDNLIKEIEDNCKGKFVFNELPQFVLMYLVDTSNKHFGYNVLDRDIKASSNIVDRPGLFGQIQ